MKKFLLILACIGLSGCVTFHAPPPTPPPAPAPIVTVTATPPVVAPKPDSFVLAPINWKVYNSGELQDLGKNLSKSGQPVVLYTLTDADYRNLTNNLILIDKFIKQQNVTINFLNTAANAPSKEATKK